MWELQEHRKFIHFSLIVSSHVRNWTLALDNYKQTSGCSMLAVICDVSSDRFLVILSICFRRICSILLFIEIIWQPLVWSGSTRYLPQTNNAMRCFTYRRFHNWISYNYIISCLLSPASSSADAVWPDVRDIAVSQPGPGQVLLPCCWYQQTFPVPQSAQCTTWAGLVTNHTESLVCCRVVFGGRKLHFIPLSTMGTCSLPPPSTPVLQGSLLGKVI